jgi:uncharacterized protein YbjT (DUF2867 family)
MEFLGGIADAGMIDGKPHLSTHQFQPIAADDVAAIVADVALGAPLNRVTDIAGPERAPMNEIIGRYLKATGDAREIVADKDASYFGGTIDELSLVPLGEARLGQVALEDWLQRAKT